MSRTKEEILNQLGIMVNDSKTKTVLELVLALVQIDLELLQDRMVKGNTWEDVRLNQGGVRALAKLTGLNGEIQRAMKPITSTD